MMKPRHLDVGSISFALPLDYMSTILRKPEYDFIEAIISWKALFVNRTIV
jgi:hypothetical protein